MSSAIVSVHSSVDTGRRSIIKRSFVFKEIIKEINRDKYKDRLYMFVAIKLVSIVPSSSNGDNQKDIDLGL